MAKHPQPVLKGFLTCWLCGGTYADYDLQVTVSPCVVRCRACATGLPLAPETIQKLIATSEEARRISRSTFLKEPS